MKLKSTLFLASFLVLSVSSVWALELPGLQKNNVISIESSSGPLSLLDLKMSQAVELAEFLEPDEQKRASFFETCAKLDRPGLSQKIAELKERAGQKYGSYASGRPLRIAAEQAIGELIVYWYLNQNAAEFWPGSSKKRADERFGELVAEKTTLLSLISEKGLRDLFTRMKRDDAADFLVDGEFTSAAVIGWETIESAKGKETALGRVLNGSGLDFPLSLWRHAERALRNGCKGVSAVSNVQGDSIRNVNIINGNGNRISTNHVGVVGNGVSIGHLHVGGRGVGVDTREPAAAPKYYAKHVGVLGDNVTIGELTVGGNPVARSGVQGVGNLFKLTVGGPTQGLTSSWPTIRLRTFNGFRAQIYDRGINFGPNSDAERLRAVANPKRGFMLTYNSRKLPAGRQDEDSLKETEKLASVIKMLAEDDLVLENEAYDPKNFIMPVDAYLFPIQEGAYSFPPKASRFSEESMEWIVKTLGHLSHKLEVGSSGEEE